VTPSPLEHPSIIDLKKQVKNIPVCLVNPPSSFLADQRVFPSLALPKLAAELEKNHNPVAILDLAGVKNYRQVLTSFIKTSNFKVFGLTTTTPQLPVTIKIYQTILKTKPRSKIIIGGPHITLAYPTAPLTRVNKVWAQLTRTFSKATLVVGDGENAIFLAIHPRFKSKLVNAGNLSSPLFMQKNTLEKHPFPARHLVDQDSYHYFIKDKSKKYRTFNMIAQLGCPFNCNFCGGRSCDAFRIPRTRSVPSIINEIEKTVLDSVTREKPFTGVMFYDDEININTIEFHLLCKELINLRKHLYQKIGPQKIKRLNLDTETINGEKTLSMRFRGFTRANLLVKYPEQARLMRKAGFRELLCGFESGDNTMLQTMNKGTTVTQNTQCAQIAHQAGLSVKFLMSLGHPGESEETINRSIRWVAKNLQTGDYADWTVLTLYPGTAYFDQSVYMPPKKAWVYQIQISKKNHRLWSNNINYAKQIHNFKGVPGKSYHAHIWTDHLTPQELIALRDKAEEKTHKLLNLPPITLKQTAAIQFDHSMGQSLPPSVLRQSN